VDFNPEDAHQYFEGVDCPATKEDLTSAAEANGAPDALVDRIGTLGGFAPKLQANTRRGGLLRAELPSLVLDPDLWCKATLGRAEFSSSEDVVEELHASPQST